MSDSKDHNTQQETGRKVGDILRDERILRDESLAEIAEKLAIRLPFMEAIENSNPESLPGAAYAIGFVRSYAEYLGMDSQALVERYKEEAAALERDIQLNFPEPLPSRGVPIGALLFIGVLLAIIFYGVWWYINSQGKTVYDYVPMLHDKNNEQIESNVSNAENLSNETQNTVTEKTSKEGKKDAHVTSSNVIEEPAEEQVAQETIETVIEDTKKIIEQTKETLKNEAAEQAENITELQQSSQETIAQETAKKVIEDTTNKVDIQSETVVVEKKVETETNTTLPPATETETASTQNLSSISTQTEEIITTATETEAETVTSSPSVTSEATQRTNIDATNATAAEAVEKSETQMSETPQNQEARTPKTYGQENADSRVTLQALEMVWVEVSKPDGSLALTRLLRTGDQFLVPNQSGLKMVTGNAGGIMILLDGQELGVAGPKGAVKRDFLLDPKELQEQLNP